MKRKFHTFGCRLAVVLLTLAFVLPIKSVCAERVLCVHKASCPMGMASHLNHNPDRTKGSQLSSWNCCKDLKPGVTVLAAMQANPAPSSQLFKSSGLSGSPGLDAVVPSKGIFSSQKALALSVWVQSTDYSFISLTLIQSSFLC